MPRVIRQRRVRGLPCRRVFPRIRSPGFDDIQIEHPRATQTRHYHLQHSQQPLTSLESITTIQIPEPAMITIDNGHGTQLSESRRPAPIIMLPHSPKARRRSSVTVREFIVIVLEANAQQSTQHRRRSQYHQPGWLRQLHPSLDPQLPRPRMRHQQQRPY